MCVSHDLSIQDVLIQDVLIQDFLTQDLLRQDLLRQDSSLDAFRMFIATRLLAFRPAHMDCRFPFDFPLSFPRPRYFIFHLTDGTGRIVRLVLHEPYARNRILTSGERGMMMHWAFRHCP